MSLPLSRQPGVNRLDVRHEDFFQGLGTAPWATEGI